MHLYAFGSNGSGQLGIGNTEDTATPQICLFPEGSEIPSRPLKIVAGGNHTLLLLEDGTVYCAGGPRDGRVQSEPSPSAKPQTTFKKAYISTLGHEKVKLCAASWNGTYLLEQIIPKKSSPFSSYLCNPRDDLVLFNKIMTMPCHRFTAPPIISLPACIIDEHVI